MEPSSKLKRFQQTNSPKTRKTSTSYSSDFKFMKKLLLPLVAVALIACSSGPYVPSADSNSPEATNKPVVLLDQDLERTIAVDKQPIASRNAQNRLTIQLGLRNRTGKEVIQVQAQTIFKDANGQVLYTGNGNEPAWDTLALTPNETKYYSQSALTDEAVKYTVRVRYLARPKD